MPPACLYCSMHHSNFMETIKCKDLEVRKVPPDVVRIMISNNLPSGPSTWGKLTPPSSSSSIAFKLELELLKKHAQDPNLSPSIRLRAKQELYRKLYGGVTRVQHTFTGQLSSWDSLNVPPREDLTVDGYHGWRLFSVRLGRRRDPMLCSPQQKQIWPHRKWLTAICTSVSSHEAPHLHCMCGIYAFDFSDESVRYGLRQTLGEAGPRQIREITRLLIGTVSTGKLIKGTRGFKAAYAVPEVIIGEITREGRLIDPRMNPLFWKIARPYRLKFDEESLVRFQALGTTPF